MAEGANGRLPPILDPYSSLHAMLTGLRAPPEELARIRKQLVWAYSWAVPSLAALAEIAASGPLIELGAGTGYWAWLLAQAGADIVAFDRAAGAPPRWLEVREGGVERLGEHPDRALFLCWPSLGEGFAEDCLRAYRGDTFLHVGELGPDARTGSAGFQARLRADWRLERELGIPTWPGFRDSLTVWSRG